MIKLVWQGKQFSGQRWDLDKRCRIWHYCKHSFLSFNNTTKGGALWLKSSNRKQSNVNRCATQIFILKVLLLSYFLLATALRENNNQARGKSFSSVAFTSMLVVLWASKEKLFHHLDVCLVSFCQACLLPFWSITFQDMSSKLCRISFQSSISSQYFIQSMLKFNK